MMSNAGFGLIRTGCLLLLVLMSLLRPAQAADTNAAPDPAGTNAQDSLRFYLQIQEQLRRTLVAIEENRQDAEAEAATNQQALAERLRVMEKTLADGRLEQMQGMERSDRMILMAAGTFAAIGFLVLLLAAFLQWTAVNRFAAAAASLSAAYPPVSSLSAPQLP